MTIDKSTWNKKVNVSQSTIDQIKKMGMSAALNSVAGAAKSSKDDASAASFAEGVRRMYGDQRYQNAIYKAQASPGPLGSLAGKTSMKKNLQ